MRVLYLDVLFLVNFCMDYMALYITGGLRERHRRASLLLAASFFGALYATVSVLFMGNETLQSLISVAVSLVMTAIAYGFADRRDFLRTFITFYAVSLLLGALITVGYGFLNRYVTLTGESGGRSHMTVFFAVAAIGGVLIRLCGKWLSRENAGKNCRVTVKLGQREVTFSALIDSGNLLKDPISGRRVIVVGLDTVRDALPPLIVRMLEKDPPDPSFLPSVLARRIRLIPTHSIGGTRILVGIIPDEITVSRETSGGKTKRAYAIDAILAIDTENGQSYGGFDAVIPTALAA